MAKNGENPKRKGRTIKNLIVYSFWLLVGLWIFRSVCSLTQDVFAAQSRSEFVFALLLLLATVGVVGFIITYACMLFARLPKIESISEEEYRPEEMREKIRTEYLSRMPSDEKYAQLIRASTDDPIIRKLKELQTRDYGDDVESFLQDFRAFQELQDEKANEVIKHYAKLIAIKTALSPWRIVDMISVFYNSTLMACDIADIYNRRTNRTQAFRLLFGWAINLYISGNMGQVAEGATGALADSAGKWLGTSGIMAVVRPAFPLLSKFAGMAVEGGVNAYLAYRLGMRAVDSFRYIQEKFPHDLRTLLAIKTAEYLAGKFSLNQKETLEELIQAYHTGAPLSEQVASRLLLADLLVTKISYDAVQYDLEIYVPSVPGKAVRTTIPVPFEADWAFAPKAFREKFIRERTDVLKVEIYKSRKIADGGRND